MVMTKRERKKYFQDVLNEHLLHRQLIHIQRFSFNYYRIMIKHQFPAVKSIGIITSTESGQTEYQYFIKSKHEFVIFLKFWHAMFFRNRFIKKRLPSLIKYLNEDKPIGCGEMTVTVHNPYETFKDFLFTKI
jgi:hypothetical protein